jgi:hypothetical protein
MTVSDYINQTIVKIFERFPNLSECAYYYDACSETHFIKVPSVSVYESDEFSILDAEVSINFMDSDFGGSLCFITDDSVINYGDFKIRRNPYVEISEHLKSFTINQVFNLDKVKAYSQNPSNVSSQYQNIYGIEHAGESNYSLAA